MKALSSRGILCFALLFMFISTAQSQQVPASIQGVSWGQSLLDTASAKIPVGRVTKQGFDWFKATFAAGFNIMRIALDNALRMVQWAAMAPAMAVHRSSWCFKLLYQT